MMDDKDTMQQDLDDIKRITSVTVKKICQELGINEKNMYNLRTTKSNVKKVKNKLINDLKGIINEIQI